MKIKKYYIKASVLLSIMLSIVVLSCDEEPIGQQPIDGVAPGVVTNINVENIAGGAVLSYDLPSDEDLLYIKGIFLLNDSAVSEVKASIYADEMLIEGFGDTIPKTVTLYAVDRSRNESEPVTVTINPLEAPVTTIGKTLTLLKNFGGVKVKWENPLKAEVSVAVDYYDDNKEYTNLETFYSTVSEGSGAVTDLDTIPYNFKAYVEDRWGNRSEILYDTITPLFETEYDNSLFEAVDLASDGPDYDASWPKEFMWDGIWGDGVDQGYSSKGGTGTWPQSVTIDLGQTGKISRFRLYQRMNYPFGEGNLHYFQIYCCTDTPSDDWDTWTLLMDCESIKPSGLDIGEYTDEDYEVALNGEDFYNEDNIDMKARYLRILVNETWAGGDNFQITELKVYGDPR